MDRKEKTWRRDPFLLSTLALVLLLMGLIFYFSHQTEEQSGDSSGAIVSFLISRLYADYDQLPPTHRAELLHRLTLVVRKTAHLLEFAALGFALRLHLQAVGRWRSVARPQLLAWGIGTLYAAADELHQLFVPGRGPRLYDVGIDSLGAILGVLFFLLCAWLVYCYKNSKQY